MSPCGKIAASAGEDKKIRIWDLAEGKQIKVRSLKYQPGDGKWDVGITGSRAPNSKL